jgi:hypothetical protein
MQISPIKGTIARLYESLVLGMLHVVLPQPAHRRTPPKSFWLLVSSFIFIIPALLYPENPRALMSTILMIPYLLTAITLTTFMTIRGKSYNQIGHQIIEENTIGSKKEVDLRSVDKLFVFRGFVGDILGVGKIVFERNNEVIFQIEYSENAEETKEKLESNLIEES